MSERLLPQQRKAQIIQTALGLFKDKGYENTTVADIIDAADISKGGFYYHYDAKEDLLEDIAQMFVGEVLAIMEQIASRDDLSALEKTNEYIRQVNSFKKQRTAKVAAMLSEMYSGGKNVQLENKIFGYGQKVVAPVMKSIIEQGVEEGDFDTDYPEEAAETYVRLFLIHQREVAETFTQALNEGNEEILEDIIRKYAFLQEVIENIFGVEEGSLVLTEVARDIVENMGQKLFSERN